MYNIYLLIVVLMLIYWLFSKLEKKKKLTTWVRILVVVFVWLIEAAMVF